MASEQEKEINASKEKVWELIRDPMKWPQFLSPDIQKVEPISDRDYIIHNFIPGIGSYESRIHIDMVVEGVSLAYHYTRGGNGYVVMTLRGEGDKTRVSIRDYYATISQSDAKGFNDSFLERMAERAER